ncbi:MAG: GPO family capsid scaffolding protein [Sterolibacterium sp.]|nr:GPO family capsid scaffolding protein [Sterolibacterium sp.]
MSKVSKPFVIATEGPTIDGRNISREMILQMSAAYDPKVYTAVANLEHLLSFAPDSLFSAYGKVVTLGTQEATILGEKKLQLTAVVEADDAVVAMQKAGKKLFASMEVVANFVGKGIAYLTGLAFTDTPASLGTETMKFSADKQSVYSFDGGGLMIEWEPEKPEAKAGETLFAKVKTLLTGKEKKDEDRFADTGKAIEAVAGAQRDLLDQFAALQTELKTMTATIKVDREAFAALKAKLDAEPTDKTRPAAAGGNAGTTATDC